MARSRNIKPGFFQNDILAEIEPLGRILFAGLWTMADREGRMEDRPKKIKAACLPYDDCNIDGLLNQLVDKRFIVRYEVNDKQYIQILKWHKHQNPHHMEVPSEIPAPDGEANKYNHSPISKKQREFIFKRDDYKCLICGENEKLCIDHVIPVSKGGTSDNSNLRTLCSKCNNKKGNRVKAVDDSCTSSGQVVDESTTPADSLNLIPDSLNLIPDSLNGGGINESEIIHTAAADENLLKIQEALKDAGILLPSAFQIQALLKWHEEGMELEAIIFAIQKASLAGNPKVNYVEGILRGWHNNNITTLAQAKATDAEFQKSKRSRAGPNTKKPKSDKFKLLYSQ